MMSSMPCRSSVPGAMRPRARVEQRADRGDARSARRCRAPARIVLGRVLSVSATMPRPCSSIDGDSLGHRAYHAMPPVPGDGRAARRALLLGVANMLVSTPTTERRARCCSRSTRARRLPPRAPARLPGAARPVPRRSRAARRAAELAEAFGFVGRRRGAVRGGRPARERRRGGGRRRHGRRDDLGPRRLPARLATRRSIVVPSKGGRAARARRRGRGARALRRRARRRCPS